MIRFNPAAPGPGSPANYVTNATFEAQQKLPTGSFMHPNGNVNVVANPLGNNTPLRISQNGDLAVEDANLAQRQPKYFFATQALIQAWNEALQATGSYYQLLPDPTVTMSFTLNGAAKNLIRVEARNVNNGTFGAGLTTAQFCDSTVKEVIGSHVDPVPVFGRVPAIGFPNQPAFLTVYAGILQLYVADELAGNTGHAAAIDLQNAPGQVGAHAEAIANAYGTLEFNAYTDEAAHPNGPLQPATVALRTLEQQFGINQFADPDVGQGVVTHRLGEEIGGQVRDNYNNRIELHPSNATLWRYHWAGVVAKDGGDFITLENYARNAEDNMGDVGGDPRFYFQMYSQGADSWHNQWATLTPGIRNFANPLSFRLRASLPAAGSAQESARLNKLAAIYFPAVVPIADDYNTVHMPMTEAAFTVALIKALAFANSGAIVDITPTGGSRTHEWITAIDAIAHNFPAVAPIVAYVRGRLDDTVTDKFDNDAAMYNPNIDAIKDDHAQVGAAANAAALAVALRKGLVYANDHLARDQAGARARVDAWRQAVQAAADHAETARLKIHTGIQLQNMKRH